MNYWLMKTEPTTFGLEHLARAAKQTSAWDGVRNFQARNMIRDDMRPGDRAFLYHSSCAVPGIVAIMEIASAARPDGSAFERKNPHFDPDSDPRTPRWFMVDVKLKRKLKRVITLKDLRAHATKELAGMWLLRRGNRLSITPIDAAHWKFILSLE